MDTHRQMLALVDTIYAAAIDVSRWPSFLDELMRVLKGGGCSLCFRSLQDPCTDIASAVGIFGPEFAAEYAPLAEHDPWLVQGRGGRDWYTGQIGLGEALVPHRVLERSMFFNEFGRRHEYVGGLSAILVKDEQQLSIVSCVPRFRSHYGDHEVAAMRHLMPHLQRALQVHGRLSRAQDHADSLAELLDRLRSGAALVDADSRVLFANRSAARLLDDGDGIGLDAGLLTTGRPTSTARLREAVRRAARARSSTEWDAGAHLEVGRPSGKPSLRLLISPTRAARATGTASQVLVFLTDPSDAPVAMAQQLRRAFGFTRAESMVAELLLRDRSAAEIAELQGVSVAAVRFHLQHLFAKTSTRGYGPLVGLLVDATQVVEDRPGPPRRPSGRP